MAVSQACWPPKLTAEPTILGYLTDTNQRSYSRDLGRSFSLAGNLYYLFADTFCKNGSGTFVGITSNTVSFIKDITRPLESSYLAIDEQGLVEPLLQLTDKEKQYQRENKGHRYILWPFSGVVEIRNGVGLIWYEKGIDHNSPGESQYCEQVGIGLAEVTIDPSHPAKLNSRRLADILFTADEPRYGSVTALLEGSFIYLYGQIPGSCQVGVARVRADRATIQSAYERWDGTVWNPSRAAAPAPVFSDLPQGAIFRTMMFGLDTPFAFVGVSKWADSMIRVGRASRLEGPWDIREVGRAEGINYRKEFRYCIYPHPWALPGKAQETSLMVTWSEHWPGGVVAGKLDFKKDATKNRDEI